VHKADHAPPQRRFDERLWQPGETRFFTVRPPPGGDAALPAYPSYRLVVVKVPGRRFDESYAAISEMRFLTAESASPAAHIVTSTRAARAERSMLRVACTQTCLRFATR
jgi:hypothetical protein